MKKMKRTLLVLIGLTLLIPDKTKAQDHEIQTNMLGIFINNYSISYERLLKDKGWFSNVEYFVNPKSFNYDYTAFAFNTEYRFYFNSKKAEGIFAGPYLNYRYTSAPDFTNFINSNSESIEVEQTSSGIALGLITGKKWVHSSGFVYGSHVGVGRYLFESKTYSNNYEPSDDQDDFDELPAFNLRFGLSIGYRF